MKGVLDAGLLRGHQDIVPLIDGGGLLQAQVLQQVLAVGHALVGALGLGGVVLADDALDHQHLAGVGGGLPAALLVGLQIGHVVGHILADEGVGILVDDAVGYAGLSAAGIEHAGVDDVRVVAGGEQDAQPVVDLLQGDGGPVDVDAGHLFHLLHAGDAVDVADDGAAVGDVHIQLGAVLGERQGELFRLAGLSGPAGLPRAALFRLAGGRAGGGAGALFLLATAAREGRDYHGRAEQ